MTTDSAAHHRFQLITPGGTLIHTIEVLFDPGLPCDKEAVADVLRKAAMRALPRLHGINRHLPEQLYFLVTDRLGPDAAGQYQGDAEIAGRRYRNVVEIGYEKGLEEATIHHLLYDMSVFSFVISRVPDAQDQHFISAIGGLAFSVPFLALVPREDRIRFYPAQTGFESKEQLQFRILIPATAKPSRLD